MGKGRIKPFVMPIDRAGEDRPSLFVGWIDALPVPAALCGRWRWQFSPARQQHLLDRLDLSPAGVEAPIELRRAIKPHSISAASAGLLPPGRRPGGARPARIDRAAVGRERRRFAVPADPDRPDAGNDDRAQSAPRTCFRQPDRPAQSRQVRGLVEQRSTEQEAGDHAILLLDLARFSRINEHIGPLAGDELIITVAHGV